MTSTTSDKLRAGWLIGLICLAVALIIIAVVLGRSSTPQQQAVTNRVPTLTSPPAPEPPKPSPTEQQAAPTPPAKERPYYGSTYFDETLTSVYFYPQGGSDVGTPDTASTHLKFSHREDDVWLCGDQRSKFEPGTRTRLTITFEPDQSCATNWKLK